MYQGDSKEVGQVEVEKSEEELKELLEKFEKNIVGSITRGIEIADSFSQESTSYINQDLTEEDIVPNFLSIDSEKRRWEFLNPIVLYKTNWMGARTEGISLNKGTYIIKYIVSSKASKGNGLALFNNDTKRVERLLFWQIGVESESTINKSGTQYLTIRSPGTINITDIRGNFNPQGIESVYIVTVFRRNFLPD